MYLPFSRIKDYRVFSLNMNHDINIIATLFVMEINTRMQNKWIATNRRSSDANKNIKIHIILNKQLTREIHVHKILRK